jgi:glucose/arabinose dehydrogenase
MLRRRRSAWLILACALCTACGTGAQAKAPDWKPKPSFAGEGPGVSISPLRPAVPPHKTPGDGSSVSPPKAPSSPSQRSKGKHHDSAVVAKHLKSPVGLTLLPDGTALVGERTTGRIVRVHPEPNKPVKTVRTMRGLDTAGDGGLLDLAISPFYRQDGLIYAYLSTHADNRLVAFTLTGPVTPVLTGIPHGRSDNAGRIAFTRSGELYIGTGDAGHPSEATKADSLAGKVLRVSDIGKPAKNNPNPSSPVYTSGHRDPSGVCIDSRNGEVFEVESRTSADRVNLLAAGASYGWPSASGADHPPLAALPHGDRGPGGCAVQKGVLYVTSLDGHALLAASIETKGTRVGLSSFKAHLVDKYGRLRTVVAAPDGALWLTTSNRDGHGKPIPADERVLRIVPSGGGGGDIT